MADPKKVQGPGAEMIEAIWQRAAHAALSADDWLEVAPDDEDEPLDEDDEDDDKDDDEEDDEDEDAADAEDADVP